MLIEIQQLSAGVQNLEEQLNITPQIIYNDSSQETNPLYLSLAEELASKKATLAEKEGEASGLQQMLSHTNRELDYLQAELAEKRMEQDKLQREVERLQKTSETLAMKQTETQIAKSIDLGDTSVVVVSEASVPKSPINRTKS